MRVSAATAAALALALASLPVAAQSLGEAAAREKARREKAAREGKARPPVKVITEDELRGRVTSGTLSQPAATDTASEAAPQEGSTPAEGAAAPASAPRPAEPEKSEEELRAERQTEWRQKLQAAQADVARLRARVDQIQAALNDMTGPIYGPNRASIANQLEQSKAALTTAEQTVASLEEEGRRNRYR